MLRKIINSLIEKLKLGHITHQTNHDEYLFENSETKKQIAIPISLFSDRAKIKNIADSIIRKLDITKITEKRKIKKLAKQIHDNLHSGRTEENLIVSGLPSANNDLTEKIKTLLQAKQENGNYKISDNLELSLHGEAFKLEIVDAKGKTINQTKHFDKTDFTIELVLAELVEIDKVFQSEKMQVVLSETIKDVIELDDKVSNAFILYENIKNTQVTNAVNEHVFNGSFNDLRDIIKQEINFSLQFNRKPVKIIKELKEHGISYVVEEKKLVITGFNEKVATILKEHVSEKEKEIEKIDERIEAVLKKHTVSDSGIFCFFPLGKLSELSFSDHEQVKQLLMARSKKYNKDYSLENIGNKSVKEYISKIIEKSSVSKIKVSSLLEKNNQQELAQLVSVIEEKVNENNFDTKAVVINSFDKEDVDLELRADTRKRNDTILKEEIQSISDIVDNYNVIDLKDPANFQKKGRFSNIIKNLAKAFFTGGLFGGAFYLLNSIFTVIVPIFPASFRAALTVTLATMLSTFVLFASNFFRKMNVGLFGNMKDVNSKKIINTRKKYEPSKQILEKIKDNEGVSFFTALSEFNDDKDEVYFDQTTCELFLNYRPSEKFDQLDAVLNKYLNLNEFKEFAEGPAKKDHAAQLAVLNSLVFEVRGIVPIGGRTVAMADHMFISIDKGVFVKNFSAASWQREGICVTEDKYNENNYLVQINYRLLQKDFKEFISLVKDSNAVQALRFADTVTHRYMSEYQQKQPTKVQNIADHLRELAKKPKAAILKYEAVISDPNAAYQAAYAITQNVLSFPVQGVLITNFNNPGDNPANMYEAYGGITVAQRLLARRNAILQTFGEKLNGLLNTRESRKDNKEVDVFTLSLLLADTQGRASKGITMEQLALREAVAGTFKADGISRSDMKDILNRTELLNVKKGLAGYGDKFDLNKNKNITRADFVNDLTDVLRQAAQEIEKDSHGVKKMSSSSITDYDLRNFAGTYYDYYQRLVNDEAEIASLVSDLSIQKWDIPYRRHEVIAKLENQAENIERLSELLSSRFAINDIETLKYTLSELYSAENIQLIENLTMEMVGNNDYLDKAKDEQTRDIFAYQKDVSAETYLKSERYSMQTIFRNQSKGDTFIPHTELINGFSNNFSDLAFGERIKKLENNIKASISGPYDGESKDNKGGVMTLIRRQIENDFNKDYFLNKNELSEEAAVEKAEQMAEAANFIAYLAYEKYMNIEFCLDAEDSFAARKEKLENAGGVTIFQKAESLAKKNIEEFAAAFASENGYFEAQLATMGLSKTQIDKYSELFKANQEDLMEIITDVFKGAQAYRSVVTEGALNSLGGYKASVDKLNLQDFFAGCSDEKHAESMKELLGDYKELQKEYASRKTVTQLEERTLEEKEYNKNIDKINFKENEYTLVSQFEKFFDRTPTEEEYQSLLKGNRFFNDPAVAGLDRKNIYLELRKRGKQAFDIFNMQEKDIRILFNAIKKEANAENIRSGNFSLIENELKLLIKTDTEKQLLDLGNMNGFTMTAEHAQSIYMKLFDERVMQDDDYQKKVTITAEELGYVGIGEDDPVRKQDIAIRDVDAMKFPLDFSSNPELQKKLADKKLIYDGKYLSRGWSKKLNKDEQTQLRAFLNEQRKLYVDQLMVLTPYYSTRAVARENLYPYVEKELGIKRREVAYQLIKDILDNQDNLLENLLEKEDLKLNKPEQIKKFMARVAHTDTMMAEKGNTTFVKMQEDLIASYYEDVKDQDFVIKDTNNPYNISSIYLDRNIGEVTERNKPDNTVKVINGANLSDQIQSFLLQVIEHRQKEWPNLTFSQAWEKFRKDILLTDDKAADLQYKIERGHKFRYFAAVADYLKMLDEANVVKSSAKVSPNEIFAELKKHIANKKIEKFSFEQRLEFFRIFNANGNFIQRNNIAFYTNADKDNYFYKSFMDTISYGWGIDRNGKIRKNKYTIIFQGPQDFVVNVRPMKNNSKSGFKRRFFNVLEKAAAIDMNDANDRIFFEEGEWGAQPPTGCGGWRVSYYYVRNKSIIAMTDIVPNTKVFATEIVNEYKLLKAEGRITEANKLLKKHGLNKKRYDGFIETGNIEAIGEIVTINKTRSVKRILGLSVLSFGASVFLGFAGAGFALGAALLLYGLAKTQSERVMSPWYRLFGDFALKGVLVFGVMAPIATAVFSLLSPVLAFPVFMGFLAAMFFLGYKILPNIKIKNLIDKLKAKYKNYRQQKVLDQMVQKGALIKRDEVMAKFAGSDAWRKFFVNPDAKYLEFKKDFIMLSFSKSTSDIAGAIENIADAEAKKYLSAIYKKSNSISQEARLALNKKEYKYKNIVQINKIMPRVETEREDSAVEDQAASMGIMFSFYNGERIPTPLFYAFAEGDYSTAKGQFQRWFSATVELQARIPRDAAVMMQIARSKNLHSALIEPRLHIIYNKANQYNFPLIAMPQMLYMISLTGFVFFGVSAFGFYSLLGAPALFMLTALSVLSIPMFTSLMIGKIHNFRTQMGYTHIDGKASTGRMDIITLELITSNTKIEYEKDKIGFNVTQPVDPALKPDVPAVLLKRASIMKTAFFVAAVKIAVASVPLVLSTLGIVAVTPVSITIGVNILLALIAGRVIFNKTLASADLNPNLQKIINGKDIKNIKDREDLLNELKDTKDIIYDKFTGRLNTEKVLTRAHLKNIYAQIAKYNAEDFNKDKIYLSFKERIAFNLLYLKSKSLFGNDPVRRKKVAIYLVFATIFSAVAGSLVGFTGFSVLPALLLAWPFNMAVHKFFGSAKVKAGLKAIGQKISGAAKNIANKIKETSFYRKLNFIISPLSRINERIVGHNKSRLDAYLHLFDKFMATRTAKVVSVGIVGATLIPAVSLPIAITFSSLAVLYWVLKTWQGLRNTERFINDIFTVLQDKDNNKRLKKIYEASQKEQEGEEQWARAA